MNFDILLATHSSLCKGFADAVSLISGVENSAIYVAPFNENMPVNDYQNELKHLIDEKCETNSILILTDIFGGTPSNEVVKLLSSKKKIEIIAGINLQLLLEIVMKQTNGDTLGKIDISKLINESQQGIVSINEKLKSM